MSLDIRLMKKNLNLKEFILRFFIISKDEMTVSNRFSCGSKGGFVVHLCSCIFGKD